MEPEPQRAAAGPTAHHGSPWPAWVALGATVLLLGVLLPWLALVGAGILAASLVGWVREDVRTAPSTRLAPLHGDRWWGVLFLLAGELVLFGTLFAFYFWVRGYATQWPPPEIPPFDLTLVTANTVVLVASGVAAHSAHTALARGNVTRFRRLVTAALLLGTLFLAGQLYEYATAGFTPRTGSYGTAFFALTGVHGFHVFVGLLVLGSFLFLARGGRLSQANVSGVGGGVLYWHFVDAVWLVLYSVVYLRVV